ncbi:MAG: prepilin peptidase [Planctomycetes bacterium]|nr:prepilin peptidase [Planctomycetota bacterium]
MDNLTVLRLLYAGILFVFGLAMGSFLNVVAARIPLGRSILRPPSSCPACGHRIAVYDNVPLFGWLVLGGRCRSCRAAIPVRYPLVELATGVVWALEGWRLAGVDYGFYPDVWIGLLELAFLSAMVVTFLVDLDYRIILDEISLVGIGIALVAAVAVPALHQADDEARFYARHPVLFQILDDAPPWKWSLAVAVTGLAAGLALSLFIHYAGTLAFRKQIAAAREEDPDVDSALGLGDVKLMALFGAFLGWPAVIVSFLVGSVLASVVGTVGKMRSGESGGRRWPASLLNRWRTGDSVLPFGPFLVVGAVAALFLDEQVAAFVDHFNVLFF